jgi:hypothetical protein
MDVIEHRRQVEALKLTKHRALLPRVRRHMPQISLSSDLGKRREFGEEADKRKISFVVL